MANGDNKLGAFGNLANLFGQYYLGTQGTEDYQKLGQTAVAAGEQIGQTAVDRAKFQPFTVTSSLADVGTTAEGGVNVTLSPEEQARQAARFGQAEGLLGRVGVDPAAATQEYFEAIRAPQRIEEERQRQGLAQSLFTRGRGGITSPEFGTTAEEFAFDKARQEAMLSAAAGARQQALAEQEQALTMAGLLTDAAYAPQRQAIDLFGASSVPSQIAGTARTTGAELGAQAERSGLEALINSQEMANALRLQAIGGAMPIITSGADAAGDYLFGDDGLFSGVLGGIYDFFSGPSTIGGTGMTSGGSAGASQAGAYTGGGTGPSRNIDTDGDGVIDLVDRYNNDPTRS